VNLKADGVVSLV